MAISVREAEQLFLASLERARSETSAYVPGFEKAETYLPAQLERLRSAAVAPWAVVVRPDESARRFGEWQDRDYQMIVVARDRDVVLVVNAESGKFSLGGIDATGRVSILGFASEDALAEWVS